MARVEELEATLGQLFRQTKSRMDYIIQSNLKSRGRVDVGTQSIQYMLNREIQAYINGASRIVNAAAIVSMDDITTQMIQNAGAEVADVMQQFSTAAKTRVQRKVGLARIHEQAANQAQQAVLRSYDQKVGNNGHLRYRGGQGRLVGRMRAALLRGDIIRAQRDGIIFGNTAVLDAVAAHWRRLNFGAGERGHQTRTASDIYSKAAGFNDPSVVGTAARPAPLKVGGQFVQQMYQRWNQAGPSPAFSMPAGLWIDKAGGIVHADENFRGRDMFYPIGQARRFIFFTSSNDSFNKRMQKHGAFISSKGGKRPTQGIEGYQFFQAGLNLLGRVLPDAYYNLAIQWIAEAADEVHPRGPIAAARAI